VKGMKLDETRRVYSLIGVLGITLMFFLMLVSIAGAYPFAYITNYGSSTVSVIDTATNKVTATINVGVNPSGVAVNPDGTKVYVTNIGNSSISVIDTATNTVISTIPDLNSPFGVAVSPDGKKLYVTNSDSYVSVIDTATNKVTATVTVGTDPRGIVVTPDGKRVYVANLYSGSVSVINTATNKVKTKVRVRPSPYGIAVTPDGTKVYVANARNNNVSVIDTTTNTVIATVYVYNPHVIAANPNGKKVYVTGIFDISVIDTATNTITATMPGGFAEGIAVSPDGKKLYVTNSDSHVSVIDTATNKVTTTIKVGDYPMAFGQFISPLSPFANFSASPIEGKAPLTVAFTDKSIRSPTKWKWTFGDGASSTQQNPTHKYSKVGRYTVTLTATNDKGGNTATKTDYIKVVTKSVANFTSSVTYGKAPFYVAFTDTSTGIPTGWKWNFGDGASSTQQNPTHKYSKAGIYTVSLTVNNVVGSSKKTKPNYITAVEKPVAEFSAKPTEGKAPLSVAFYDTSKGSPIKWKWSFGDGKTSTQQNPMHKYSKAGKYKVALTATNNNSSNTVTKTDYITVIGKPVANFTSTVTYGKAPLTVNFADTSTGIPNEWKWKLGDGTTSTFQNFACVYPKVGNYTVSLTVKNAVGSNTVTKTDYIIVIVDAEFSAKPTEGKSPLTVAFTDESIGSPTKWNWSFGDGASSTQQNPTHKYSNVGKYTVTLTAISGNSSNTVTKTDYIKVVTKPVANFTSSVTSGKAPLTITFNDTSTGIPTGWRWSFGDGKASTIQNPIYIYSKAGNYTVSLAVKNAAGRNTVTKTDYIKVTA
jgi:YVTN family beta-propeller protein